jgi:hypothetical protein
MLDQLDMSYSYLCQANMSVLILWHAKIQPHHNLLDSGTMSYFLRALRHSFQKRLVGYQNTRHEWHERSGKPLRFKILSEGYSFLVLNKLIKNDTTLLFNPQLWKARHAYTKNCSFSANKRVVGITSAPSGIPPS